MGKVAMYAIEARVSGLVKIGSSDNPTHRFKTIQAMSPEMLEPRIIAPENGRELEREFHNKFKYLRQHGEWFTLSNELVIALFSEEFKHLDREVLELIYQRLGEILGK